MVPTYNRPERLARLLAALQKQEFSANRFEVILINDGGPDLECAVAPFRATLSIQLLTQDHGGCAVARQWGIEHARGRLLAFTDDDCKPAPDWLSRLHEASLKHPGAALGGAVVNGHRENLFCEASQQVVNYISSCQNSTPAGARYFPTNNLTFPAEAFQEVGGLDTTWRIAGGEDRDLCHRWVGGGYHMVTVPEAVVQHLPSMDQRRFLEQHFHYGRGAFLYRRKVRTEGLGSAPFENWKTYIRLPFAPFGELAWGAALRVCGLLCLSQIATLAGYAYERFGQRRIKATAVPATSNLQDRRRVRA